MGEGILKGKVIVAMKIADDKKAILFITDGGNIIAKCDGDCCSSTWVEHIDLPVLGFYEVIEYYGCRILTDKGDIVIDYRNESNWFYGGNLSWPDDDSFYGGVHGQNISNENWIDINSDT